MTAFGRSTFFFGDIPYSVEIRTTNSRYLDIRFHLPWALPEVERKVMRRVRDRLKRGRVEINVRRGVVESPKSSGEKNEQQVYLVKRFNRIYEVLQRVGKELQLKDSITIADLLSAHELLGEEIEPVAQADAVNEKLLPEIDSALDALIAMRCTEGVVMDRTLSDSLEAVSVLSDSILALAAEVPKGLRRRLEDRLAHLTQSDSLDIDSVRLAQEVAILADKADITEEVTRIRSHIDQIKSTRRADAPHGRKLEFLLQEIQREVNTVASKTPDVRIARAAVEIKTELEKMREIAQNVE
jgi:uncharacterized protein (TIGR00255 family)